MKKALIEATALAQPDSEGEFVLDTDASPVAMPPRHSAPMARPSRTTSSPTHRVRQ